MGRAKRVVFVEPFENECASRVEGEIVCDGGPHRSGAHDDMVVLSGPVSHAFREPPRVISPPHRHAFEVSTLGPRVFSIWEKGVGVGALSGGPSLLTSTGAALGAVRAYAELGGMHK